MCNACRNVGAADCIEEFTVPLCRNLFCHRAAIASKKCTHPMGTSRRASNRQHANNAASYFVNNSNISPHPSVCFPRRRSARHRPLRAFKRGEQHNTFVFRLAFRNFSSYLRFIFAEGGARPFTQARRERREHRSATDAAPPFCSTHVRTATRRSPHHHRRRRRWRRRWRRCAWPCQGRCWD
jgi:hypothetical protein